MVTVWWAVREWKGEKIGGGGRGKSGEMGRGGEGGRRTYGERENVTN